MFVCIITLILTFPYKNTIQSQTYSVKGSWKLLEEICIRPELFVSLLKAPTQPFTMKVTTAVKAKRKLESPSVTSQASILLSKQTPLFIPRPLTSLLRLYHIEGGGHWETDYVWYFDDYVEA